MTSFRKSVENLKTCIEQKVYARITLLLVKTTKSKLVGVPKG
jgi:hypothetical protein